MRVWTVERVRAVEKETIERLGVPSLILMENAGTGAAAHARRMVRDEGLAGAIVLCGAGNNGGDGLVVARHLAVAGIPARVALLVDPAGRASEDFHTNLRAARACDVAVEDRVGEAPAVEPSVLVVDAMLGTGAKGAPRTPFDRWIAAANESGNPILALDVPSGLDADTGEGPQAVRASRTVTFVAAKPGFFEHDGPKCCGEVVVHDISIPPRLLAEDRTGGSAESP